MRRNQLVLLVATCLAVVATYTTAVTADGSVGLRVSPTPGTGTSHTATTSLGGLFDITAWHTFDNSMYMNFRVPADVLKQYVHPDVEIDTFDGSAWATVMPTRLTSTKFGPMPFIGATDEIQLHTYVKYNGVSGLWVLQFFVKDGPLAYVANKMIYRDTVSYTTTSDLKLKVIGEGEISFDGALSGQVSGHYQARGDVDPATWRERNKAAFDWFTTRDVWFGQKPSQSTSSRVSVWGVKLTEQVYQGVTTASVEKFTNIQALFDKIGMSDVTAPTVDTCGEESFSCFVVGHNEKRFHPTQEM
eukprot:GFYU01012651.1.p1 GENE.GFYU01012651.1~~GFYU01012651.1.p1  ORF type:complete len:302 (-),score=79.12 GFYU01012651.1:77-982(-)